MTEKKVNVDLGLDLLKETAPANSYSLSESDELFSSAQILWNEGWVGEAKKILRQILRWNPAIVSAQKLLDEILAAELADYLGKERIKKDMGFQPERGRGNERQKVQKADPRLTESKLLADLFEGGINQEDDEEWVFQAAYIKEIEQSFYLLFLEATAESLIDYAVALQEMDLKPLALKALNRLITFPAFEDIAKLMQAEIFIQQGEAKNVLAVLDSGISMKVADHELIRLYYIARGYELFGRNKEALLMYEECIKFAHINSDSSGGLMGFRDTRMRIRTLKKGGWII